MANLEEQDTIKQLLCDIRRKDEQLCTIREEINKANRDYEYLSISGAIRNMRLALDAAEAEIELLKEDLYKATHKWA